MLKEIKSRDEHGGWTFSLSSSGIKHGIVAALCAEFKVKSKDVDVGKLRLLSHVAKTFVFRAKINIKDVVVRTIVGVAAVDISVHQPAPGEEYAASFVKVSYE